MVLNNLLDGLNGKAVGSLTAEEKEARSKLISSIVAGTAAATGGETAAATIAAKLETENNALAPPFLLPGIPGKPQVTPLPGLPGYNKTEQDLGLEPRGFAEQLAELMGKGLEGIPLTQAGWAQYFIENLGGAVRVYDPNSYSNEGGKTGLGSVIDPKKFDYLFGNSSSNGHNANRSKQLAAEMERLGLSNNASGQEILADHFKMVSQGKGNIINSFTNKYGSFEVRDSLLIGSSGKAVKLETTFQKMPDGSRRVIATIPRR
ncbi:hypothetical protein [Microvirgula aerodenitrificans]|nr:hypothetical protein [Microvirgula aerodenitrificans]